MKHYFFVLIAAGLLYGCTSHESTITEQANKPQEVDQTTQEAQATQAPERQEVEVSAEISESNQGKVGDREPTISGTLGAVEQNQPPGVVSQVQDDDGDGLVDDAQNPSGQSNAAMGGYGMGMSAEPRHQPQVQYDSRSNRRAEISTNFTDARSSNRTNRRQFPTTPVLSADLSAAPAREKQGSEQLSSLGYAADGFGASYQSADMSLVQRAHPGNEEYQEIEENPFTFVQEHPLSTFSIDVDTASYSNVRRFVMENQLPPEHSVRIEELINYFTYDYPQPETNHPFAVYTEVGQSPWNAENKLVQVGLQGKLIPTEELPNSNMVFLLDVSGSMKSANKLPLVKSAFKLLVHELRPNDRVAIVTYAGSAGLALPSTAGNQKQKILEAINRLEAGGSTAGGEGIQLAYRIAKENFVRGGNNRVILATDGDFNVGISDTSELVRLIEEKRKSGIFLSIAGFGTGNLKDEKMESLADKGNGNYSYIDNLLEAKKVFVNEMGGTFFTIAKDVKIQVEFNPAHVKAYRLIGYENRMLQARDFNDDTKDAGEIGAGHSVTALYEVVTTGSDYLLPDVDELKYQESKPIEPTIANNKYPNELMTVKLRYKKPDEDTSRLLSVVVDKENAEEVSDNMKFSTAVAEFGLLLRNSSHKGDAHIERVIAKAKEAKGEDDEGYRAEFIRLAEMTELLLDSHVISRKDVMD